MNRDINPFAGVDFNELEKSLRRPRTLVNVLLERVGNLHDPPGTHPAVFRGLDAALARRQESKPGLIYATSPRPARTGRRIRKRHRGNYDHRGAGGSLISVPLGILSAVFMAQAPEGNRLASAVRFSAKVLTGFPSILAGVFAYGALVMAMGGYSAIAGAVAVSILMLPTIMLTAEDAIRMVPAKMKEAAIGMGATKTQTVLMVLLPTAHSRDSHRRHAGRGARGRGDGPAAFYRSLQQLLADVSGTIST